jgi:AcrR family transcriptional regulator
MGRLSTIDDGRVFSAVGSQLAGAGSLTLQDVVAQTGVSIGSLYHRYRSREELLARTWLDAVIAFQEKFLAALESDAADAGEQAAMAVPRFCRAEPQRARVLISCRRQEFLSDGTSDNLKKQIASINENAAKSLSKFARSRKLSVEACRLGLVAYPLGAVRLYLPDRKIPKRLDAYVAAAYLSAINT